MVLAESLAVPLQPFAFHNMIARISFNPTTTGLFGGFLTISRVFEYNILNHSFITRYTLFGSVSI